MSSSPSVKAGARRAIPSAVSDRLRVVLIVVFSLFAVLAANSLYLVAIRVMEAVSGHTYQNFFYLQMFLAHLVLGALLIPPLIIFLIGHLRVALRHPNRRAVKAGFGLMAAVIVLIVSGIILTRIEGVIEVNDPQTRAVLFWIHLIAPLVVIWLYILHRLAGKRINWRLGAAWMIVAGSFVGVMIAMHSHDPRRWNVTGPASGEQYFFPSLARTSNGNFIPVNVLNNDRYCYECHREVHRGWLSSAHRLSSFNNPAYLFSVKNTRRKMMERHGKVNGSRFCAGCHDPVPFFSGAFDDPKFDDPEYDLAKDASAQAGITCSVCHSVSHINSPKGNAAFTIDEPIQYPFTNSNNSFLRWVSRQLVKAKPQFHKSTFLKPLHRSPEFCGSCHKVHLPVELNDYKWLRGQNHYDSFWLSGVSGHNVESFYYPPVAEQNCNRCHLPLKEVQHSRESPNFAARIRDDSGVLKTLDHQFPSANTAVPYLLRDRLPDFPATLAAHEAFVKGTMRVDVFGIREEGRIDGALTAPLDVKRPTLQPGATYLFENVIRTLKLGHLFTEGTGDSNEIWLDVTAKLNGEVIGRSGGMNPKDRAVDPWSHFVNAFVIDRNGFRINRRNAEDIFIALYNNQIPPGAAQVVHYRLAIPADAKGELTIDTALRYRKFDTEYMRLVMKDQGIAPDQFVNDLPIMTLVTSSITLPVGAAESASPAPTAPPTESPFPLWQRWNDYGIGLLLRGHLRQADDAFAQVQQLGVPDGPLNRARVYLREGRVSDEAPAMLRVARETVGPKGEHCNEWTLLWLAALVSKQNGEFDAAVNNLEQIVAGGFAQADGRGMDFAKDYRLLNELADTYYVQALQQRGADQRDRRTELLHRAEDFFKRALGYDPENVVAHYGLYRIYLELGESDLAAEHEKLHQKYKVDDNARDFAIGEARRRYPAADVAAEQVVIYDLQRPGAFELPVPPDPEP